MNDIIYYIRKVARFIGQKQSANKQRLKNEIQEQ